MRDLELVGDDVVAGEKEKIAKQYEGIWSISNDDIVNLEKEIEINSQIEECYDELNTRSK